MRIHMKLRDLQDAFIYARASKYQRLKIRRYMGKGSKAIRACLDDPKLKLPGAARRMADYLLKSVRAWRADAARPRIVSRAPSYDIRTEDMNPPQGYADR